MLEASWMELIAERLAAGQKVKHVRFRGVSMLPMLRQKSDSVELATLPEALQKYDIPVYRREDGKYVMHRIIRVEQDCCICRGDNTLFPECIRREQMIGVVSAFWRGDKRVEADAFGYRLYCRLWQLTYPLRKGQYYVKRMLRKGMTVMRNVGGCGK